MIDTFMYGVAPLLALGLAFWLGYELYQVYRAWRR